MCCFYAKCVISVGIYTFCVRYCAAFTQCVQLVFESASFTQSIHAIIGSFTDIAKIVVLLLQWNLWLNLSIYAVLSRIRYCRDLRVFCVNLLSSKCRSRKSFDKYHVCLIPLFRRAPYWKNVDVDWIFVVGSKIKLISKSISDTYESWWSEIYIS